MTLLFENGRIIDPSLGRDESGTLIVRDGIISDQMPRGDESVERIDCTGLIVSPGLIDLHAHLREPGGVAKETIETGSRAAAAGGFTSVLAMPNTSPPVDSADTVVWITQRAAEKSCINIFVCGCISKNLEGKMLAPIGSLAKVGVRALSDAGSCIQNSEVMRRALEYSKMFELPLLDHCQDNDLSQDGVMHEGHWSTVLGLAGWPAIAEEAIVARNALLAELTGGTVVCQHLSSGGSVRLIREARERGVDIHAETTPHHITLSDACLEGYNPNFKMKPPLRTPADHDALIQGLADGTIEYLASDHAPHCNYEKEVEFSEAPFGIIGLETCLGALATRLVHETRALDWSRLLAKLTINPAKLLKLDRGTLAAGAPGDITLIDPDRAWTVDQNQFLSKARNTPWHGRQFKGRAVRTYVAGREVWAL